MLPIFYGYLRVTDRSRGSRLRCHTAICL